MQKDKLFDLIKSLDKNEKGYLKKYLLNKNDFENKYFIILFDYMQDQIVYDEQSFKITIKDKGMLKHFASHKIYLYESIMKFLIAYHSQNSLKNQVKTLIRCSEILYQKALYQDANSTLLKALDIAKKNEFFLLVIEIHDLLYLHNVTLIDYGDKKQLNSVEKNQKFLSDAVKNYVNLFDYRSILIKYYKIGRSKASIQGKRQKLATLIQHTHLNNSENARSLTTRFFHNQYNGMIHLDHFNKPDEAAQFFIKAVLIYEKFPINHSPEHVLNYIVVLNNLMAAANIAKNETLFNEAFYKIDQLIIKQRNPQLFMAKYIINNKLLFYIRHAKIKEGLEYVQLIEKELNNLIPTYNYTRHLINIEIAIIYFMNDDYKCCALYLKKMLLDKNVKLMDPDLNCFASTLWLLAEYQLGNFNYVEHLHKSIERKVKMLPCDTFIAQQCFLFIKTVNQKTDLLLIQKAYKILSQKIQQYPRFNFVESFLFSIADWAKEKSK